MCLVDDDGGALARLLAREWGGDDGGRGRDACVEGVRRAAIGKMTRTHDRLTTAEAAKRLATRDEAEATKRLEAMGWEVDRETGIAMRKSRVSVRSRVREDAMDVVETCARSTAVKARARKYADAARGRGDANRGEATRADANREGQSPPRRERDGFD